MDRRREWREDLEVLRIRAVERKKGETERITRASVRGVPNTHTHTHTLLISLPGLPKVAGYRVHLEGGEAPLPACCLILQLLSTKRSNVGFHSKEKQLDFYFSFLVGLQMTVLVSARLL